VWPASLAATIYSASSPGYSEKQADPLPLNASFKNREIKRADTIVRQFILELLRHADGGVRTPLLNQMW